MIIYNFARLIEKYNVDCKLVREGEGSYEGGDYVAGAPVESDIQGAIVPMEKRKMYSEGGNYKTADRDFYTTETIDTSTDTYIVHNGKKYKVEVDADYKEDYADFNRYTLRWVSSFDRSKEN